MNGSHERPMSGSEHGFTAMPERDTETTPMAGGQHASMGMSGPDHRGMDMRPRATRPQIAVVAILTVIGLVASLAYSAAKVNLRIAGEEVKGAVMPPGMIMTNDTPAQAMRDMAAVDPDHVSYTAAADERGDRTVEARVEGGVHVYDLDVSVIEWNILNSQQVMAYAFNRQVPGPRIRITQGDKIRINVTNNLPDETSVHWHGLILPNAMDGPGDVTQTPIQPGETFSYEFTAVQAGTFFYHSHTEADRQQALGMYGALIIEPADRSRDAAYDYHADYVIQLQEWTAKEGYTFPSMPMEGALPNFFTINGKAYPDTETIEARVGDRIRFRFVGSNAAFIHPMHIHGGPFTVVETDGEPIPEAARFEKDTINVGPGERYDVVWEARQPGKWLLHCHIPHHTTNNNVEQDGGGGLTIIINVTE
jgi:FtsP/CotA-like multicopper oxidase with cupredoxin domain